MRRLLTGIAGGIGLAALWRYLSRRPSFEQPPLEAPPVEPAPAEPTPAEPARAEPTPAAPTSVEAPPVEPTPAEQPAAVEATEDPAEELRRKLAEARETVDDRDEFDAAEGTPVDQIDEPRSLEERRRAVHEQAQEALGRMQQQNGDE